MFSMAVIMLATSLIAVTVSLHLAVSPRPRKALAGRGIGAWPVCAGGHGRYLSHAN